jgi:tripartite-type tricarboxylate transporter receptor subunit TctC
MKRLQMTFVAAILALFGVSLDAVKAQDWPARAVRVVAPFAPGGTADTLGRVVADQLSETFKQQFFVENRAGAGGLVGSAQIAKADPDGYSFLVSGIASHVIAPAINANAGFDPLKDFSHIAYFGGPPIVIIAHPSLGVKTLKDLLTLAKGSKDAMGYVSPGPGTLGNLVAEYWARKENIKLDHIPYKGAAQAVTDLIAGHVKMGSMTWTTARAHIAAGTVIPLAVSSAKRLPDFPNLPTLKELGYDDLVAVTWFSFSGPPGLPKDMVTKLNAEVAKALDLPEVKKRLEAEAIETEKMSPEEFTKFVDSEYKKWAPIAKAAMSGGSDKPAR